MEPLTRRTMLSSVTAMGVAAVSAKTFATPNIQKPRLFTMDLRGGSIGVGVGQLEANELAAKYGFESVNPDPRFLASLDQSGQSDLLARMKEQKLAWGAAGLPVEFRQDEAKFSEGLRELPSLAKAMQQAGVTRVGTWLRPMHDELTYVANFRQHARRLRECVKILADHGQRFGMEYVGPKTLWASSRHSFIHSMAETRDLIAEIGMDNVGFVLDSWHWYTAHETVEDLKTLTNHDIVACDLNDAPDGIPTDEQIDSKRELPATTGVINLQAFLQTLVEIGYNGPVRAEPFNAALNALDNDAACKATATAMKKAFSLIEGRLRP